ncbi:MAG: glycosyl transferase [Caldimicrobium thiodismutans]|uniref:Glycosyl transferase n=1 Tax=Caldimicrobium thiodismutans TaxID=1653476 RepID=A0A2N7PK94_9BACT|nr:MAG: glycosyl transferase [Caldimicrobium thiodismutans]
MKPLVSVIIPTYNRDYILEGAIKSVLKQTYKPIELIVVDDGSKDQTPFIVKRYPLKYVRLPKNFGVSFARNRGILKSKGELIAFLDSDDEFLPQKIEKQVDFFLKNLQCKVLQTEELWYKGEKRLNPKKHHAKAEGFFLDRAVKLCVVSISTVMLKREVFHELGLFDEEFPVCEDYEYWLRVALHLPVYLLKEPLVVKHGGRKDQLSERKGLDFYRIKALLKTFRNYYPRLSEEEKLLILAEAKRKTQIFSKGALKHGNLKALFELSKMWSNFYPKALPKF